MYDFSTAYLIVAGLLIAACVRLLVKRQRGEYGGRVPMSLVLALNTVALGGLWIGNHEFIAHWIGGEKISFGGTVPLGMSAPVYYVFKLALLASPVLMLLPPVIRRPWLVAAVAAVATFPISYAELTPGC